MIAEFWISVEDIAHYLGMAKVCVYRWIEKTGEVGEWVLQDRAGPDLHRDNEERG